MKRLTLWILILLAVFAAFQGTKVIAAPTKESTGAGSCNYNHFGAPVYAEGITKCMENDAGMAPCKPGGASFRDSTGTKHRVWDTCTGQFFLSEFVCSGDKVLEHNIGCPAGCVLIGGLSAKCI